jgi:hypothetical protein
MADEGNSSDDANDFWTAQPIPESPWPAPDQGLTKAGLGVLDASMCPWPADGWTMRIMGFSEAAQAVFDRIESTPRLVNVLIFPLVFLWRHAIELQLKALIDRGQVILQECIKYPTHHRLEELWAMARKVVDELEPNGGSAPADVDRIIKELSSLDPNSMSFRYHQDTKGAPTLSVSLKSLNAGEVNRALAAVSQFLDAVGGQLDDAVDYVNEMAGERY